MPITHSPVQSITLDFDENNNLLVALQSQNQNIELFANVENHYAPPLPSNKGFPYPDFSGSMSIMILAFGSIPVVLALLTWMCRGERDQDDIFGDGKAHLINDQPRFGRHSSSEYDFEANPDQDGFPAHAIVASLQEWDVRPQASMSEYTQESGFTNSEEALEDG